MLSKVKAACFWHFLSCLRLWCVCLRLEASYVHQGLVHLCSIVEEKEIIISLIKWDSVSSMLSVQGKKWIFLLLGIQFTVHGVWAISLL